MMEVYTGVVSNILTIANIVIWGGVAIVSIHAYFLCRGSEHPIAGICWLHLTFILLGIYWCALYVWVFIATETAYSYDTILFGRVFVRPVNVFTAAAILAYILFITRVFRPAEGITVLDHINRFAGLLCKDCAKKNAEKDGVDLGGVDAGDKRNEC